MLGGGGGRSLRGGARAALAGEPHQDSPCFYPITVFDQPIDRGSSVERPEERPCDLDPGDDDRLATVHFGGEERLLGNRRGGGHIAPGSKILSEDSADEVVEIEVSGRRHQPPPNAPPPPLSISASDHCEIGSPSSPSR